MCVFIKTSNKILSSFIDWLTDLRGMGIWRQHTVSSWQLGLQFACNRLANLFRKSVGVQKWQGRALGRPGEQGYWLAPRGDEYWESETAFKRKGRWREDRKPRAGSEPVGNFGSTPQVIVVILVLLIIELTNGVIIFNTSLSCIFFILWVLL